MYKKMNFMGLSFCLMTFLLMVSCGDNGEPLPVTINPVTISGIAGTGSTSTAAAKADFFKAANQAVSANSVIPNGAVTIFDKLGKVLGIGTTDANGLFSVDVTPGVDYFIKVVSQDGATAVRSYLADAKAGLSNAIVNAFSSTLVFAMEQRLNIKLLDGGFTGEGLSASADQILAAAGFKDLVAKIQVDLANGNVTSGLTSAQAALTALLEGLPALPSGGTGGTAITISAGSGLTPAYTFNGGAVNSLSVMRTSAPTTVVWGITTPLSDGITSPLTHNTVGNGVVQTFSTETTLTAGVEYRVVVTRTDGSTGFASFTASAGATGGGTGGTGNSVTLSGIGVSDVLTAGNFVPSKPAFLAATEKRVNNVLINTTHLFSWYMALGAATNGVDGTSVGFTEVVVASDQSISNSELFVSSVDVGARITRNWSLKQLGDLNSIAGVVLDKIAKTVTFTDVTLEPVGIGNTIAGPVTLNGTLSY